MSSHTPGRSYSPYTATTVVIASMVGTGVLTSLGFQAAVLKEGFSLLLLWFLGGVASLCGALCYAELGNRCKGSGGEYRYLRELFHPALGFMAGWVSFLIGFSAPVAASGLALGTYISHGLHLPPVLFPDTLNIPLPACIGFVVAALLTLIHSVSHSISGYFQNISTAFKVLIILALILMCTQVEIPSGIQFLPGPGSVAELLSPGFVISLYFVSYAYSGWNASAYIAGEIQNPQKNLPRSLIAGTLIVMALYVLLNAAFLWVVPIENLSGQVDVGLIYSRTLWGSQAGEVMGILISLLLISGMSSMTIAGSRVTHVMSEDYPVLKFWAVKNSNGIPVRALYLQFVFTSIYLFTATFDEVILYIGFTLNVFAFLSVLGLLIQRIKYGPPEHGFRVPLFPWIPLVFLVFSAWLIGYGLMFQPREALTGIAVSLAGVVFWYGSRKYKNV